MPELITVLVGLASLVLGWGLKTLTDSWTWRRQQVLGAYLEMLDAADRYGALAGSLWSSGITKREKDWAVLAEQAREHLMAVDRAYGKLSLVAGSHAAALGFELYLGCERMFRRAVALPPSSPGYYREASAGMVKIYQDVVDEGRREMALRRWYERGPGVTRWDLMQARLLELDKTDPYPDATNPGKQPPAGAPPV